MSNKQNDIIEEDKREALEEAAAYYKAQFTKLDLKPGDHMSLQLTINGTHTNWINVSHVLMPFLISFLVDYIGPFKAGERED